MLALGLTPDEVSGLLGGTFEVGLLNLKRRGRGEAPESKQGFLRRQTEIYQKMK